MHRTFAAGVAALLLVVSAASVAAATAVKVPADTGWVSTGISVTAGQTLDVSSRGYVITAPIPAFLRPGEFKSASGPAGQATEDTCGVVEAGLPPDVLEITGPCILDEAYFGELIGRVGGTTFRIGSSATITAPATGVLELGVNDLAFTLADNAGTFIVLFP
ncbi:MAG TPA: hypothetical protein VFK35_03570 [Candidatus Limnocylindrales bacterium]|nr:hypothetical protein [Candidatus Limnocylindrales bacterium]